MGRLVKRSRCAGEFAPNGEHGLHMLEQQAAVVPDLVAVPTSGGDVPRLAGQRPELEDGRAGSCYPLAQGRGRLVRVRQPTSGQEQSEDRTVGGTDSSSDWPSFVWVVRVELSLRPVYIASIPL